MKLNHSLVSKFAQQNLQEKLKAKPATQGSKATAKVKIDDKNDPLAVEATFESKPKSQVDEDFDQVLKMSAMGKKFQLKANKKKVKFKVDPSDPKKGPLAGTVFVIDSHDLDHGNLVSKKVEDDKFKGSIEKLNAPITQSQLQNQAVNLLVNSGLDGPKTKAALKTILEEDAKGMFEQQAGKLDELSTKGVKNSAVNISRGSNKASATYSLYKVGAQAWESTDSTKKTWGENAINNMAAAFNLDPAKLLDSDLKVSAPERQKLQAELAMFSGGVMDNSPVIKSSKAKFDQAVVKFESNNNSVVLSAGNEGMDLQTLAANNDKLGITVDESFYQSIFHSKNTTSVGATKTVNVNGKPVQVLAEYSNQHSNVTVHANGSMKSAVVGGQLDTHGTSFSAPSISAVMAELHKANPGLNSDQVQELLLGTMTMDVNNGQQTMKVLDPKKTEKLFYRNKI